VGTREKSTFGDVVGRRLGSKTDSNFHGIQFLEDRKAYLGELERDTNVVVHKGLVQETPGTEDESTI